MRKKISSEYEVLYSSWFGGWIIINRVVIDTDWGKERYTDFPEAEYGVLDSMHVPSHKTKEDAEKALARIKK